jgi:sortase A
MKRKRSRRSRLVELTLWALGAAFLGVAFADASARWNYQEQQERAVFSTARSNPVPVAPVESVGPLQPVGPAEPERKAGFSPPPSPKDDGLKPVVHDPNALGRIEIPRIGVRAMIRKGADDETLARAVGLVPGTAEPGETGNVVLAAHRDTFFRPLRNIRVADRIKLIVPPNEYVYEVDSTRIVSPEETSVLQSKGTEELTLVTCYPFGFLGPAPDRFIVSAKRVQ